jgi:hypothetical protein
LWWLATLCIFLRIVTGVAVAAVYGNWRWGDETETLRAALLVAPLVPHRPATYDPRELDALPSPVARYLQLVLRHDQATIRRARIVWRGEFNLGSPGADNWKPFDATQDYAVDPPGFVWDARIAMLPGLPVMVRDSFVSGRGSMRGMIAGLFSVVDSAGTPAIAGAALQRHLGEAIWFPTALLPSQGLRWEAIDATRARATLATGDVTAAVEFTFGTSGLPDSAFVPARLYDDGKSLPAPHPWRARNLTWGEIDGATVPIEAVAEWLLPSGTYAYWRGGPVAIRYEYAAPSR